MTRHRIASQSTRRVLKELRKNPQYGYAIMKAAGLKSGTLYPILMRLKNRGLLQATWEPPQAPGRPQRQIYTLTAQGQQYANDILDDSVKPLPTRTLTP